jgi:multiple sugar transport system ATP-binding protein
MAKGEAVTVGIRPEFLSAMPGVNTIRLTLAPRAVERLGLHTIIHGALGPHAVTALLNGDPPIVVDAPLDLHVAIDQLHLFDNEGRRRNA